MGNMSTSMKPPVGSIASDGNAEKPVEGSVKERLESKLKRLVTGEVNKPKASATKDTTKSTDKDTDKAPNHTAKDSVTTAKH